MQKLLGFTNYLISRLPPGKDSRISAFSPQFHRHQKDPLSFLLTKSLFPYTLIMATKDEIVSPASTYPTTDQISAIFTKVETPAELENLQALFAKDFHGVVTGHDHSFAGEHHSHETWFGQLGAILDTLEHEKTFTLDIVRVIGGGSSPWACMEAKARAKTKTGL